MAFILYCSHLFVSLLQNQQSHEIQSQKRDQAEVTNLWKIQGSSRTLSDHREQSDGEGNGPAHWIQRGHHRRRPDECRRSRQ